MKKLTILLGLAVLMLVSVSVNAQNRSYRLKGTDLILYENDRSSNNTTCRDVKQFAYYNYDYVIVLQTDGDVWVCKAKSGNHREFANGQNITNISVQGSIIYLTGSSVKYKLDSSGNPKPIYN